MEVFANSRSRAERYYVTQRGRDMRGVIVVVTGRAGETASVVVTFVSGAQRASAIFHLPRLP
jgi:hypothetical protein